eukprot:scaffold14387_cov111-Skeletonema_menzelii.AAC.1
MNFQTTDPYALLPVLVPDGCPGEYDSSESYEVGDTVEDDGAVYTCVGAAAYCNLYAPNLRNVGANYWQPTNSCSGVATPTVSPTFGTIQAGCPEEFDSGTAYYAGDSVSVTRDDGVSIMYTCKPWPASQWCSVGTYSPLSTVEACNGGVCWPEAWISNGACTGTFTPTSTPTFDPADIGGCPEEYEDGTQYLEHDKVSVTPAGETYGKIYQCKGWPASGYCGQAVYSPLNTEKLCNGDVCWPEAWVYVGGCTGTNSPTSTPTFDPADIGGCPDEYIGGTAYEEGDIVSVTPAGETYGKIYQCLGWPFTGHCGQEAYSPLNTEKLCNGDVCWPIAWTYVGGCTGTISPTSTPTFDPADVGGCPDEYVGGTEYDE